MKNRNTEQKLEGQRTLGRARGERVAPHDENDREYATFRNEHLRGPYENPEIKLIPENPDRVRNYEVHRELDRRRQLTNPDEQEGEERAGPPIIVCDLDEIQMKARQIEEKKRKIDNEIEKRIFEENERRKRAQYDNSQKPIEKHPEKQPEYIHRPYFFAEV